MVRKVCAAQSLRLKTSDQDLSLVNRSLHFQRTPWLANHINKITCQSARQLHKENSRWFIQYKHCLLLHFYIYFSARFYYFGSTVYCIMPMSCLCHKSTEETEFYEDDTYHEFQVANSQGKKWKAKSKKLHQEITLSMSVGKKLFWRFEREKDEPLWSFHVLSKTGKKLYLSYREDSNEITLELKDDGDHGQKRFHRLFVAHVQENDRYLFRASKTEDRYIGSDGNEELKMFTTKNPSENMLWLVKEELDELESQQSEILVQITKLGVKWISNNAQPDQPIPVRQNGNIESWNMKRNPGKWTFSPSCKSSLFASSNKKNAKTILFEDQNAEVQLIEYKPVLYDNRFIKLQNLHSNEWVGVTGGQDSILNLQSQEDLSMAWDICVTTLPYVRSKKTFFFPPLLMPEKMETNVVS